MKDDNINPAYAKKIVKVTTQINDAELVLEYGRFAEQATSAVFATLGSTQVLAIVTMGKEIEADYFPMSVEFQERLYAGGKIKGSRWIKREGRPSDDAVLIGRMIDRSARPLFPKHLRNDLQIIIHVLSVDGVHDPAILGANATFAALAISPLPWKGPIGMARIGMKAGQLMIHPNEKELEESDLDLVVSSSEDKIVMIEAGGKQIPEAKMLEAINLAHEQTKPIIKAINELVKKVGQSKLEIPEPKINPELAEEVDKMIKEYLTEKRKDKQSPVHEEILPMVKDSLTAKYDIKQVLSAFDKQWRKQVREMIKKGTRPDGRKPEEIRQIGADVGLLARTHGSGIFRRGTTHVLSITALQPPDFSQIIESAASEEIKRFIHYYSMPPYATGETGRLMTGRREIGHGALAEKALEPVIPDLEKFPYTIMVMSEVMSSNGSTSMGATCGTTLSLMDAGVPILAPVSGIAMGLIEDAPDEPMILTDIAGIEDFNGDMDFKIAGTEKGITAIQLDIKTDGLELNLIEEVLQKARIARLEILQVMLKTIDKPRDHVSEFAPKVTMLQIPVDKIGEVIGPGGRVIRQITADTGAEVDVEDDGKVIISCVDEEKVEKASEWIKALTTDPEVGQEFKGKVMRIVPFGAFVEILPGKEGLVHISRMGEGYVEKPEDVVSLGDEVTVKVYEIDDFGRVNLSLILSDSQKTANGSDTSGHSSTGNKRPFNSQPFEGYRRQGSGQGYGSRQDTDENRGRRGQSNYGPQRGFQSQRNQRDSNYPPTQSDFGQRSSRPAGDRRFNDRQSGSGERRGPGGRGRR